MGWAERLSTIERQRHEEEHKEFLLRCRSWSACASFRKVSCTGVNHICWRDEEVRTEKRILNKAW